MKALNTEKAEKMMLTAPMSEYEVYIASLYANHTALEIADMLNIPRNKVKYAVCKAREKRML